MQPNLKALRLNIWSRQVRCYLSRSPGLLVKALPSIRCPENHFFPVTARAVLHRMTLHSGRTTWDGSWQSGFPGPTQEPGPGTSTLPAQEPALLGESEPWSRMAEEQVAEELCQDQDR